MLHWRTQELTYTPVRKYLQIINSLVACGPRAVEWCTLYVLPKVPTTCVWKYSTLIFCEIRRRHFWNFSVFDVFIKKIVLLLVAWTYHLKWACLHFTFAKFYVHWKLQNHTMRARERWNRKISQTATSQRLG